MPAYFKDIITVLSMLIAAAALYRNVKGDTKAEGGQVSEVLIKIELMQNDLKEIKADFKAELKSIRDDNEDLKERMVIVEQSCRAAHKRIDAIHGEHYTEE